MCCSVLKGRSLKGIHKDLYNHTFVTSIFEGLVSLPLASKGYYKLQSSIGVIYVINKAYLPIRSLGYESLYLAGAIFFFL